MLLITIMLLFKRMFLVMSVFVWIMESCSFHFRSLFYCQSVPRASLEVPQSKDGLNVPPQYAGGKCSLRAPLTDRTNNNPPEAFIHLFRINRSHKSFLCPSEMPPTVGRWALLFGSTEVRVKSSDTERRLFIWTGRMTDGCADRLTGRPGRGKVGWSQIKLIRAHCELIELCG